jgi:2-iminobutanoate/2-iminopropanoate deaminase
MRLWITHHFGTKLAGSLASVQLDPSPTHADAMPQLMMRVVSVTTTFVCVSTSVAIGAHTVRAQAPRVEFGAVNATAPLTQFVRVGETIYLSGMLGTDADGIVAGGTAAETRQALSNVRAALEKSGATMDDVVKCTVFLADIQEWAAMNEVYATFFPKNKPARSAVGVNGLARGGRVEIECLAIRGAGGR